MKSSISSRGIGADRIDRAGPPLPSCGRTLLRIERTPWETILRHALECAPQESCGVLLGSVDSAGLRTVARAIPCVNSHPGDRTRRFRIDPEDLILAQQEARAAGLQVLGYFHSHPGRDAYFSDTDLAESHPAKSNLVVSVRQGRFCQARAFRTGGDGLELSEEELQIESLP
jgi:proteasome lid subunit RPN8/RPN11